MEWELISLNLMKVKNWDEIALVKGAVKMPSQETDRWGDAPGNDRYLKRITWVSITKNWTRFHQ
jgi:hypothetical protein